MILKAKAPADVRLYTWEPDVGPDDSLASFTLTATGATIDAEAMVDGKVEFYLSAGTAGATASVLAEAVTDAGAEISETLYIPIIATGAQIADTARDYINFAMRKIVGVGDTASAAELDNALEMLSGMIAEWREGGADISCAFPLDANTVIYCPDWAVSAIRYNLRMLCYAFYGQELSPIDVRMASRGLQLIKQKNLPTVRKAGEFF